jgi:hypothetical protein
MTGNEPSAFTDPELVFNSVGIVNQDVWKTTFLEGTPTGMMWLTPDCRVILSDFSTYQDVGYCIQDVLGTINISAIQSSFAIVSTMAPYSWYMLFVPTGSSTVPNTTLLFDLQSKKWVVWHFANTFAAGLHHITATGESQLILCNTTPQTVTGPIFRPRPQAHFDPAIANGVVTSTSTAPITANSSFWLVSEDASGDGTVPITSTIQTAWIGGATPDVRKLLNELELIGPNPNLTVNLDGTLDFRTITNLVSGASPVQTPFGQMKVYFNNIATNYKYYRLTFNCVSAANTTLLNGFALEALFFNRL